MRQPPPASDRRSPFLLVPVLLGLLVLSVFVRTGVHDFVAFDDDVYITENEVVRDGLSLSGVGRAFTGFHGAHWHPLTLLSHMLDVDLFGLNAGGHHLVSVFFHLLNTVILYLLLHRMTRQVWKSFLVAALFGVHPLHVESVAWAAQRKDVLFAFFWILTTLAYVRYVERPGKGRYAAVAALLALGLMSKPAAVTLPFALLLFDFWPLGRTAWGRPSRRDPTGEAPWGRLLLEKAPLLALSAIASALAYLAQSGAGATPSLEMLPLGDRAANMAISYVWYLGKTVWPAGLCYFYPYIYKGSAVWEWTGAGLLLSLMTALAVRQARTRPWLATGWFFYLGTLVPMIGLVQAGSQAVQDKHTYIPLTGIFIAAVWSAADLAEGRLRKGWVGAAAAIFAFSVLSFVQAGYWRNTFTLSTRALEVTENNWEAHNALGVALTDGMRLEEAAGHFGEACRIMPDYVRARYNLATVLARMGRIDEAIANLRVVLRKSPDHAGARNNIGSALLERGQIDEAILHLREALRLAPEDRLARSNLEEALRRKRRSAGGAP